ncbi:unnamed protein product [Mytilus edulis]|uniref:Uncharacterized protein n=1 Tax=Mytilus edulis TaxID=6550 RepID=A0A8S3UP82_MYTED|nr:unnamed protein product [Mytilus edulis]
MASQQTKSIEHLVLTLEKDIYHTLSNVRGCTVLPDGKIVFPCYTERKLKVFKADGSQEFEMKNIGRAFDVAYIEDGSIAVTTGGHEDSRQINIFDLKNKKLIRSFNVETENYGVVFINDTLIYTGNKNDDGLYSVNLEDESVTRVKTIKLSSHGYIATFNEKLFYTDNDTDSVHCCDIQGNIKWTFSDKSALSFPLGISVDNHGNVFVVGAKTKKRSSDLS